MKNLNTNNTNFNNELDNFDFEQENFDFEPFKAEKVKPLRRAALKRLLNERKCGLEAAKLLLEYKQTMSLTELKELTRKQAIGDQATTKLIEQYKPLVFNVLKRLKARNTHTNSDLYHAGVCGLMKALVNYDPNKGTLESYAFLFIKQEIIVQFGIDNDMLKIPRDIYQDNKRIREIEDEYIAKHGAHIPYDILMQKIDESDIDRCRMQQEMLLKGKTSYNIKVDEFDEDSDEVAEVLRDKRDGTNVEERAHTNIAIQKMLNLISDSNILSKNDKDFICQIYGIGTRQLTQAEIAKMHKITRAAVNNRKKKILLKLKKAMSA